MTLVGAAVGRLEGLVSIRGLTFGTAGLKLGSTRTVLGGLGAPSPPGPLVNVQVTESPGLTTTVTLRWARSVLAPALPVQVRPCRGHKAAWLGEGDCVTV